MKIFTISVLLLAIPVLFFSWLAAPKSQATSTRAKSAKATFAGGCFWCMEKPFENLDGVLAVTSGYTGGNSTNPTYKNHSSSGHLEAVEIIYDPQIISYQKLLDVFWRQIDPTDSGGQFVDRGSSYQTAIYYHDTDQQKTAIASKNNLDGEKIYKKPVITPILAAGPFYPAEDYHQDYYKKNPIRYKFYRYNSGRDQFLKKIWDDQILDTEERKKYSKKELKQKLTPMQYKVTQEEGTEPPFKNQYWDNKNPGIYVDIVSGEALFSSLDKFNSGTGWPSFSKPMVAVNIIEKQDKSLFTTRTEVKSKEAGSHLGHVFNDGPAPTGLRYCINSAALRFIALEDLKKEGYGKFLNLFR